MTPPDDPPDASFDGGTLDCGNGLLLLIRRHIDPLDAGQVLEVRSREPSVADDLPAWSRLTGNALLSVTPDGDGTRYRLLKARNPERGTRNSSEARNPERGTRNEIPKAARGEAALLPLSSGSRAPGSALGRGSGFRAPGSEFEVMGVGSWPRPAWLVRALHEWLAGRMSEADFDECADDAVRLCVAAQLRAGVDVVTDGEQRRDNYASFVASRLDNCQLIPVTDLLPYVTDPAKFAADLAALDVPADRIRHPAVFGKLKRSRSLTGRELAFTQSLTDLPVKVALPGPYLLTRTMGLECVSDKAYPDRESLAADIVTVLREEALQLLSDGAAIVQFDEPVLTEVVFARPAGRRTFMCGALGGRGSRAEELAFAGDLLRRVLDGLPRGRVALHVCRGNWSRDESVALSGPYTPLVPLLASLPVGTFFLEMATPRAGELAPLTDLPRDCRIGVGVVNQKLDRVETVEEVTALGEAAVVAFGAGRVLLNPDCGFATFADSPVSSAAVAEQKLGVIVEAARVLRERHGLD